MKNKDNLSAAAITEQYEDLVFAEVMKIYMEEEYEKAKPNFVETRDISPIEKLYDKVERKKTGKAVCGFVQKAMRAVAALVLVAAISFATSVAAFADFRTAVAEILYRIITEEKDTHTEISIGEATDFVDPELYNWEGAYAPTYMPEGYEFAEKIDENPIYGMFYKKDSQFIRFWQYIGIGYANTDTEEAETVKEITIGNSDGLLVNKRDVTYIYWQNEEVFLSIEGSAEIEDIIAVAESVKPIK